MTAGSAWRPPRPLRPYPPSADTPGRTSAQYPVARLRAGAGHLDPILFTTGAQRRDPPVRVRPSRDGSPPPTPVPVCLTLISRRNPRNAHVRRSSIRNTTAWTRGIAPSVARVVAISILTRARLILRNWKDISPEQAFILGEMSRYFEHPSSGVRRFEQMNSEWRTLVHGIRNGQQFNRTSPEIENTVASWHQEERDVCLILSRRIGEQTRSNRRAMKAVVQSAFSPSGA